MPKTLEELKKRIEDAEEEVRADLREKELRCHPGHNARWHTLNWVLSQIKELEQGK